MATNYSANDFAGMLGLTSSGLPIGTETLDTLLRQMGIANPYAQGGEAFSVNESGNRVSNSSATLTPEALAALQGYDFNWQQGGPANSGTFSATGNGKTYSVNQQDETLGTSLANWAALAAAGFGGVGLMGLGPLGGLLGGAGAAGGAAGGGGAGALGGGVIEAGMADAAANLAAYGSTAFAPANVAATLSGIPSLGAAGVGAASAIPYLTADAGAGLAEFGAGAFTPSNVAATSAGIPTIGAGASAAPAVFNAAKDSQAANAAMQAAGTPTGAAIAPSGVNLGSLGGVMSAAGGGILDALKGNGGLIGDLLGTGAQLIGANKASDAIGSAADKSNELLKYMYDTTRADNMPALNARNQSLTQATSLLANPSSITSDPGYQFGLSQGIKAYDNSGSAKGMRLSGQQAKALTQYGQDYGGTKLTESLNRLMAVASGGQAGAGTIASAGNSYANAAASNIGSAGTANALVNASMGNNLAGGINNLTAYGIKKNWWEN